MTVITEITERTNEQIARRVFMQTSFLRSIARKAEQKNQNKTPHYERKEEIMRTLGYVLLQTHNDAALGRAVGVSGGTIARWRKNEEVIPFGMVQKLAQVQGLKLSLTRTEKVYS